MSGICGIAFHDLSERLTHAQLTPMLRALDMGGHDKGFSTVIGSVGVGVQAFSGRLAGIAETSSNGGPLALAFHGSLYNPKELFLSNVLMTDPSKGLLGLYREGGLAFLARLRGEFVLALWDGSKETLFLATDRFRVHPLFYYKDRDKLVFSSRMKGILACPLTVKRTINPEAIVDMVASSVIPTPKTIFWEVKKLPPGSILTYKGGEVSVDTYWDIDYLNPSSASVSKLSAETKKLFREAIRVRMGDTAQQNRIGVFLSGGVDSSTVTGVLSQLNKRPIKSFSIGFGEQRFNEIHYARIAARAFGSEHYEYFVSAKDAYDTIPILLEGFDEPYGNASAIPTYFCIKMAREHGIDILYAGDGGDELFAGNERYATQRLFEYYNRIPPWLRKHFVKPLVFSLADRLKWQLVVRGKKYIQRASVSYPERLSAFGVYEVIPMKELFCDEFLETIGRDYDSQAPVRLYYFQAAAKNELDRQLYIDLKLAISDNDLFKVTRMSEAVGIIVRFPFLDHRLAEFAASIPANIKMRGRQLRSFFKKTYADLLPLEIRNKEKRGFGLPIPVWLRTDKCLNEMMHDLVLSPRSIQRGYFRRRNLEALVECHKRDETMFYGTVLWNLMMLELWHRSHFDR